MTTADELLGLIALGEAQERLRGPDLRPLLAATRVAGASYLAPTAFKAETETLGFDGGRLLDLAGGVQCGLSWREERTGVPAFLVVSPRGTGGAATKRRGKYRGFLRDVRTDITAVRRITSAILPRGVTAGAGFVRQAEKLHPEVAEEIYRLKRHPAYGNGMKTFVACHSLGAADGLVLALALHHFSHPVDAVVALESPRPGGRKFSEAYERIRCVTWRVVNLQEGRSSVTRIPYSWMGARHVGALPGTRVRPVLLADHGEILESPEAWEQHRSDHPSKFSFTPVTDGFRGHGVAKLAEAFERRIGASRGS